MENDVTLQDRAATVQPTLDVEPQSVGFPQQPQPRPAPRAQIVQSINEPPSGRSQQVERAIVRYSESGMAELFAALSKAQGEFQDIERTRQARIESARAKYTFEYETLADVIEATKKGLSDNGLSVMQFPFPSQSSVTVRTMLAHAAGGWIYNDLTVSIDGTDPRSVASGITYICRYARKAMLGVAAGYDDDAEAASQPHEPVQRAQRQSAQHQGLRAEPTTGPTGTTGPVAEPVKTSPPNIGRVKELAERQNGTAMLVKLDTGFEAGVTDPEIMALLRKHEHDGVVLELTTRSSSNPAKFAPVAYEVAVRR